MNRRLFIGGLIALGFAMFCGVLANGDYHDPVGIAILIFWAVTAGLTIGLSFSGEKETTTEDAKHKVD
jgi:ABC-type multidrug transport system permease subunit